MVFQRRSSAWLKTYQEMSCKVLCKPTVGEFWGQDRSPAGMLPVALCRPVEGFMAPEEVSFKKFHSEEPQMFFVLTWCICRIPPCLQSIHHSQKQSKKEVYVCAKINFSLWTTSTSQAAFMFLFKTKQVRRKNVATEKSVASFPWYNFSFFLFMNRFKLPLCNQLLFFFLFASVCSEWCTFI